MVSFSSRLRAAFRPAGVTALVLVIVSTIALVAPVATASDDVPSGIGDDAAATSAETDVDEPHEPFFGQDRTTGKFLPEGTSGLRPLVVLLHGYSMSVEAIADRIPLLRAAAERGWYLIAPSGLRDSLDRPYWNATPACCDRNRRGNDDVAYLRRVIGDTIDRYPIDPERVVVVGLSNGAFMAYQLGCRASDLVVGIVALAGVEGSDPNDCKPRRPVSIFHIHGTRDRAVFFKGGILGVVPEVYAPFPSAEETVHRWADRNECPTAAPEPVSVASGVAGIWENCSEGTIVRYNWVYEPHNLSIGDAMIDDIVAFIAVQRRPAGAIR